MTAFGLPTARIDDAIADLLSRRDGLRVAARQAREQADAADLLADALNAEIGDWTQIRSAVTDLAMVQVGVPQAVGS